MPRPARTANLDRHGVHFLNAYGGGLTSARQADQCHEVRAATMSSTPGSLRATAITSS
jgi:hypothetical protein